MYVTNIILSLAPTSEGKKHEKKTKTKKGKELKRKQSSKDKTSEEVNKDKGKNDKKHGYKTGHNDVYRGEIFYLILYKIMSIKPKSC